MLTSFWQGLGTQLSERWVSTVFAPAFGFWFSGLLAFVFRFGWSSVQQRFTGQGEPAQIALSVGALLLVAASAAAVQPLTLPVLRLLEGYYWPRPLRRPLVAWRRKRIDRDDQRWQSLDLKADAGGGLAALTPDERTDYAKLDRQLRLTPADPERQMPTALGNILRAAEDRPWQRYGLVAEVCWPRLWLLLPETARNELTATRARLDTTARLCLWGALFIGWTIWAWWAVPLGLAVMFFAYRSALSAAAIYGDLLEATFDLHRMKLYAALRFAPPTTTDEIAHGQRLSEYLLRGPPPHPVPFHQPEEQTET